MRPFLITLSPAKKFHSIDMADLTTATSPLFIEMADALADNLKRMSISDLQKIMDISTSIAELNHQRYQTYHPHQVSQGYPAAALFAGDAYKTLDYSTFTPTQRRTSQDCLFILSGLYGLLRPQDMIQPYRLEMGSRVKPFLGHDLYAYWRSTLTAWLNQHIAQHAFQMHIDLASVEYGKALDHDRLSIPTIRIVFADEQASQYRVVGIKAKRARGLMARFLITHSCQSVDDIRQFNHGYAYSEMHSDNTQMVFLSTD